MLLRTLAGCLFVLLLGISANASERWSEARANQWYAQQPWLTGANYVPASAINQLEMWQAESFDPQRIDTELGWAQSVGMNTMRVFLHDLLWQQDPEGFKKRVDLFLTLASKHNIKPMFVLFDSCWDPNPELGRQRRPTPGVHNSGWVQSPSAQVLFNPAEHVRLEAYVKGIVGAFADDPRVLAWDIWNEPDNRNESSYADSKLKVEIVHALLPKAFEWARSVNPSQPLTSGVWHGDWSSAEKMSSMAKLQIELSDIISFHNYSDAKEFERRINWLQAYNRPLLCTEYMARGASSTFQSAMPVARKYNVAAINWGLVAGKSQTYLPWDSWQKPYVKHQPKIWFHDVFRADGTPYNVQEADFIRSLSNEARETRLAKQAAATAGQ